MPLPKQKLTAPNGQYIYGQWTNHQTGNIWAINHQVLRPSQPQKTKTFCEILWSSTHQVLRLSENGIESVDRKAFMNLGTSLEQLDLSGNSLKLIEEETFRPLYGLQVSLKPCSHMAIEEETIFLSVSPNGWCEMMHNHNGCICLNQLKRIAKKDLLAVIRPSQVSSFSFRFSCLPSHCLWGGSQKSATMAHKQREYISAEQHNNGKHTTVLILKFWMNTHWSVHTILNLKWSINADTFLR